MGAEAVAAGGTAARPAGEARPSCGQLLRPGDRLPQRGAEAGGLDAAERVGGHNPFDHVGDDSEERPVAQLHGNGDLAPR